MRKILFHLARKESRYFKSQFKAIHKEEQEASGAISCCELWLNPWRSIMTNDQGKMKFPNTLPSPISAVLMYWSTCQATHTSSFTLWQLSEEFFFSFGSITHNCTHFRTQLRGWCSVRAPTARASVPPPGTAACSIRAFRTLEEGKLSHRWEVCASPGFPAGCGQLWVLHGVAQGSMVCPHHSTTVNHHSLP